MREAILKTIFNGIYFSGLQAVSSYWTGGTGGILMLHHVRENDKSEFAPNSHLQITPRFLDRVLSSARKSGFELASMDQVVEHYQQAKPDPNRKLLAITLDDGYRDNLQNAVPVFEKHNAPFTIFIAPGLIDGRADLWWEDLSAIIAARDTLRIAMPRGNKEFDVSTLAKKYQTFNELVAWLTTNVSETEQRKIVQELAWMYKIDTKAHCKNQLMTWQEIHTLNQNPLCTIGAHTIHHYAVARLSEEEATWEMRESAKILKAELGQMPEHFAYPYGYPAAAAKRDFDIARDLGFKSAVTTRHGVLQPEHGDHLHALPRISLNGKFQSVRHVKTMLCGLPTLLQNKGKKISVA